jgi:hypothetical protein
VSLTRGDRAGNGAEPDQSDASTGGRSTVAQTCLVTAGGLTTTLAGLIPTLAAAGYSSAIVAVSIPIGVGILGVIVVGAIAAWRHGR